jgi:hypothetical protein
LAFELARGDITNMEKTKINSMIEAEYKKILKECALEEDSGLARLIKIAMDRGIALGLKIARQILII